MSDELPPARSVTLAIRKVLKGDSDAFMELVGAYQRRIEAIARGHLGRERLSNVMAGADVTQRVFLELWQGLSEGRTWFVETVTDRQGLLLALERMTWLRASKAVRHSLAARRRGTVRDSDVTLPTGIRHSETFLDDDLECLPSFNIEFHELIKEAERKIRLVNSESASTDELIGVFHDLLNDVPPATTADASTSPPHDPAQTPVRPLRHPEMGGVRDRSV